MSEPTTTTEAADVANSGSPHCSPPFATGDNVRCKLGIGPRLVEGNEYVVEGCEWEEETARWFVSISGISENGQAWMANRFVKM